MTEPGLTAARRAIDRCRQIAACTEVHGETTRLYLCPAMREVHELLRGWMEAAGMAVRLDAAGSLRGLHAGEPGADTLLIGSHLDTVPNAGAFDGVLGVVLGLAAVEALGGKRLPFGIEVIGFAEEEGIRYGKPFLGSLALIGKLDEGALALTDCAGKTVGEALAAFGCDLPSSDSARLDHAATIGYLEVHIEQGPVLEREGAALGIVSSIVGQTRARLAFRGRANHAGTTPMHLRHDALAACAAWLVGVEATARETRGLVATVGHLLAEPNAPNVIASHVRTTLDLRHADDRIRTAAAQELLAMAQRESERRGVQVNCEVVMDQPAVPMDAGMTELLGRAAWEAGYSAALLPSGAGHDAMVLAPEIPAAMLFVRSPGGLSHHPDESVLESDVAAALQTVMTFLELLRDETPLRSTEEVRHA